MMLMSKIGIKGLYPHYFLYGFQGAWGCSMSLRRCDIYGMWSWLDHIQAIRS